MQAPGPDPLLSFATTRWTMVLRAQGQDDAARLALGELCQAYWQAVYRFLLREGRNADDAAEVTQGFFARLLAGDSLAGARPSRGRFRSYLLGALKHYLANQRARERRLKRGGGAPLTSIDHPHDGEDSELQVADPQGLPPDAHFDREWALAVMDGALKQLQREFVVSDKAREFEVMKAWLAGPGAELSYAAAAQTLGLSEVAVKVAVHRLRKRFRELVRAELAQTVAEPSEVDDELRYLVEVLAQAGG